MDLDDIKGIGPKTKKLLNSLNIYNKEDLLSYYPYRYNFYNVINIDDVIEDKQVVIVGLVETNPKIRFVKRKLNYIDFKCLSSNKLINVRIFNRAFFNTLIVVGNYITLIGKYSVKTNTFLASNIKFEKIINNEIEPVYHTVNGLKNKQIYNAIKSSIDYEVKDYIPNRLNKKYNFITKKDAIQYIHFPESSNDIKKAKLKLIYEELFIFLNKIKLLKENRNKTIGIKRNIDFKNIDDIVRTLPFSLTNDQLNSLKDIISDLNSEYIMNRIIIGDVGSGKTIVAILSMYANYLSGYQSAFMAPTEILAIQHYNVIKSILPNLNISLLTGKLTLKEKKKIKEDLLNGITDIVIGTHAILTEDVIFKNLGLVITDEQHRFGVKQRDTLFNKGNNPDILYLSATPIPRTYALTIYGDMDLSLIKDKPLGRKEIKTYVRDSSSIKEILSKTLEELKKGHQIYVVSPMILSNDEEDLTSVEELKSKFDMAFNGKVKCEILHGKLKKEEKANIIEKYKKGDIKVLICTTVIEVGIDIPNATMIIIFDAFKFGLSTLHQLRGRVGRNDYISYCYLVSDKETERLNILEKTSDGFLISEEDFNLRREGDLFGVKQSGDMVFKIADLQRDYKILEAIKKDIS